MRRAATRGVANLTFAEVEELSRGKEVSLQLMELLDEPVSPRPDAVRLQAPICVWATYRGGRRWATLKAFFREAEFHSYLEQLSTHYPDRLGAPRHPEGGFLVLSASNAVLWCFPFDPAMPGLGACLDGVLIARALGADDRLEATPKQYRPEVGALFAYTPAADMPAVAFGKVAPAAISGAVHAATRRLWDTPARHAGVLRIPRPLAYRPDYGLLLQTRVPGEAIGRDRNRAIFRDLVRHAGPALAAIHSADAPFGPRRGLEELVARLNYAQTDVALAAPRLLRALRTLVSQIERRQGAAATVARLVPSHGDYKYDQFLEHEGLFTLIDFELFCQAEPELDLGTFCAYLPNTTPRDWREGAASEVLRSEFLLAYEQAQGAPIDHPRLALYEAAMLGIRGLSHVWTRQRDWQVRASQLLDLALERLLNPAPVGTL
jgi:hypothetical protein